MKNKNLKSGLIILILAALMVPLISMTNNAGALSKACQNSATCMEAVAKEQDANKKAAEASKTANALERQIAEYDSEIAGYIAKIVEFEAESNALLQQIDEKVKKMDDDQDVLVELLVYVHLQGDTEPIQVLAGSDTISDLMNEQMRNEILQDEISDMIKQIKKDKQNLEDMRAEVELKLEQQEVQKAELEKVRREQKELAEKYKDDADAYEAAAKDAQAAQRAAEQAEQAAHPELYRGSSYTGANTYPWQADCPGRQDDYVTYWEDAWGVHKIGGLVCECVSYVGWKAYEAYGVAAAWGNAYSWDDTARALGYVVNNTPAAGTIGQADGFPYGHVFWVESVNTDGSINVTEYNNSYATYLYSGSMHFGDFGSRKISANEVWQYNFIHF